MMPLSLPIRTKDKDEGAPPPKNRTSIPGISTSAYRTRSKISPPNHVNVNVTAGGIGIAVDDAIAKRRAELRRLQENRRGGAVGGRGRIGGTTGGLEAARSKLGGRSADHQPPSKQGAVALTAALVNQKPTPALEPIEGSSPSLSIKGPTLGAAPVARRLDASYGPVKKLTNTAAPLQQIAQQRKPKSSKAKHQRQAEGSTTKAAVSLQPFSPSEPSGAPVRMGAQPTTQHFARETISCAATLEEKVAAVPPSASSPSPAGLSPSFSDKIVTNISSPKSPFGQQRATARPIFPVGKGVPAPPMVPPLAAEPNMKPPALLSGNDIDMKQKQVVVPTIERNLDQKAIPNPPISDINADAEHSIQAISLNQAKAVARVESREKDFKKEDTEIAKGFLSGEEDGNRTWKERTGISNQDGKETEVIDERPGIVPSSNMTRLVNDLQRTEKEKKEALEQVRKLKMRLEGSQRQNKEESHNHEQKQQHLSSVLSELEKVRSTKGESAAVAWISKQLETSLRKNASEIPVSASSRERNPCSAFTGAEDFLSLSSIIPPLTPRSRPNSRAASPERGGSGGLLLSQALGSGLEDRNTWGKRMTTPLPKQMNAHSCSVESENGGHDVAVMPSSMEGMEEFLVAAAKSIPNEYGTRLASYIVRRPYAHGRDGQGLWACYSHLSSDEEYSRTATAYDSSSLEIVACIEADGSVFTLAGRSNGRHGKSPNTAMGGGESLNELDIEWAVFDDVEEMECPLGRTAYIDVEGNEREYWLDSIYEEALTTRESYCMSLISAAFALKEVTGGSMTKILKSSSPNASPTQSSMQSSFSTAKTIQPSTSAAEPTLSIPQPNTQRPNTLTAPPMPSKGSGNKIEDDSKTSTSPTYESNVSVSAPGLITQPPISPEKHTQHKTPLLQSPSPEHIQQDVDVVKDKVRGHPQPTLSTKEKQPAAVSKDTDDEDYDPADSALPLIVIYIVSLFFSMVWLLLIKLPFKMGWTIFKFFFVVVGLRVLLLFFADDGGAWVMGAGVDYEFNMAGIY